MSEIVSMFKYVGYFKYNWCYLYFVLHLFKMQLLYPRKYGLTAYSPYSADFAFSNQTKFILCGQLRGTASVKTRWSYAKRSTRKTSGDSRGEPRWQIIVCLHYRTFPPKCQSQYQGVSATESGCPPWWTIADIE